MQADGFHLVWFLVVVVGGEVRHVRELERPDAVSLLGHGQPVRFHVRFGDMENVISRAQFLCTALFDGEHGVALIGHLSCEVRTRTGCADNDDVV